MCMPRRVFRANNLPLADYILFAYKIAPNQQDLLLSQLPKWAATDRFDIQARAEGNPTKDQMRLMMQSVLAERFRLAAHHETRQVPVFALLVEQPGKLGPLLQKHPEDSVCSNTSFPPSPPPAAPAQALDSRFPATCGGEVPMVPSAPGRVRGGARRADGNNCGLVGGRRRGPSDCGQNGVSRANTISPSSLRPRVPRALAGTSGPIRPRRRLYRRSGNNSD